LEAYNVDDDSDEDFGEEDLDSVSDVPDEPASAPLPTFDDDEDDLYGVPPPESFTSRTPASKRRRFTSSVSTPISTKSKSSASSVFSPMDSVVDTPATSVSGSISSNLRKSANTLQINKRKIESVDLESEESEFEIEEDEDDEDEDEDESLSIAPTVSSDEPLATTLSQAQPTTHSTATSHRRRHRGKKRFPYPDLSQWQKTHMALCEYHPELACIWDELETSPQIQPVAVPQPEGLSLRLLPFQLEGLDWLLKQEQQERFVGGILADEMGMGKTIQTIALLLAEPRGKPNLVVAPTVALMQWKSEIEVHTNNGLSVCLFYGANRSVTAKELKNYDVVLTTCTTLLLSGAN